MGSSSYSTSSSLNPISDNKPTLSDSPTDIFQNRTSNINESTVGESLFGDSVGYGSIRRAISNSGPSLTDSNLSYNLSGGSSITDGGAVMAMFNIASKALDLNSPVSMLQAMNDAKSGASGVSSGSEVVDDTLSWIKEFLTENKTLLIGGGLVLAYLIYKGVSK